MPSPAAETALHTKQSRTALNGIFIIAIVAAMYFARDFLLPVILALFVALTFRPAVRYLAKRGIPPSLAAAFFVFVLIASGILAVYLLSGPLAAWIDAAPQLARDFAEKLKGLRASLDAIAGLSVKLQEASAPAGGAAIQEVTLRQSPLPAMIVLLTGYPAQLVVTLGATVVIAAFLMASGDMFYEKLIRILPKLDDKKRALRIVYDIEHQVSVYLLTFTAINAGLGFAIAVTFHALGMPSPYLWGVIAFVLNFIPYVGPIAGFALAGFVAAVVFDSLSYALLAPLAYGLWSMIESQIVTPRTLERRLHMNAVAILLTLAFWTWLWGIGGAVIAVPLLVATKVFCEHMEGFNRIGEFLSARHDSGNGAPAAKPV
jgi:predicted PurR-regulated permease PerM